MCTGSCPCSPSARRHASGKYAEIEAAHYSDDDYERIDAIYESERPRGREKRYWEDVNIGDALPAMVKGPLTVTEIIAFHAGGYGFVPYGLRSSTRRLQEPPSDRAVLHQEPVRRLGRRPAAALGQRWAKAIGNPHGLRLRRAAPSLVLPPRLGLGRRRRVHREDERFDPQVQLQRRHPVPLRRGRRKARRATGATSSTSRCRW